MYKGSLVDSFPAIEIDKVKAWILGLLMKILLKV